MKTETNTEKPMITWTNFKGQWMLKSNVRLTEGSFVEVTKKDGSTATAHVGEYEHKFNNADGVAHIFNVL